MFIFGSFWGGFSTLTLKRLFMMSEDTKDQQEVIIPILKWFCRVIKVRQLVKIKLKIVIMGVK